MSAVDLIRKKRDSGEHSREELEFLISGYTNGDMQSAVPGEDEFYAVGQYQSEGLIGSEASRSQTPHRPISHVCQGGLLFLISTHACRKLTEVRTKPKMEGKVTNQAQLIHCASEFLPETKMKGALPDWLRVVWFFAAPVALAFAIRIVWEKTVWTILRGPQTVGFSLMHIHPGFFVVGVLCAYAIMLWLVPAIMYLALRRKGISGFDIAMVAVAVFVLLAVITPDTLLASGR